MHEYDNDRLPAELAEIAHQLREDRPRATGFELDQIKQRALVGARRRARRRDLFMRSRLAITTMLVAGILMSGAGAGLAVSGVSGSDNASKAGYPTISTEDVQTVLPTTETNTPTGENTPTEATETRQVASNDDSSLPFTGYAAIPVLLAGIGLLGLGLVMRRRASHDRR
jgi:hypothetical protein